MAKPIPDISQPVVDASGRMSLEWYRYFKQREQVGLSNLPDVKITSIANGQVPVWNSTDGKWENGAN